MLLKKRPMVTYARLGGTEGMELSRSAFAVMIKFSDLTEDFMALVDILEMQANLEDEGPERDASLIEAVKEFAQGDMIF